jgi:ubiquitin-like 1-activating enzyme E1 A
LQRAEASLARAQQLNPMVEVTGEAAGVDDKSDDFFKSFTVIIATNVTTTQIYRLNRIARENEIKFFAADVFGFFGYIFLDLGEHQYKL